MNEITDEQLFASIYPDKIVTLLGQRQEFTCLVIRVNKTITEGLQFYEATWYKNTTEKELPIKDLILKINRVKYSDIDDYFCQVRDKRTNELSNIAKTKMKIKTFEDEYDFGGELNLETFPSYDDVSTTSSVIDFATNIDDSDSNTATSPITEPLTDIEVTPDIKKTTSEIPDIEEITLTTFSPSTEEITNEITEETPNLTTTLDVIDETSTINISTTTTDEITRNESSSTSSIKTEDIPNFTTTLEVSNETSTIEISTTATTTTTNVINSTESSSTSTIITSYIPDETTPTTTSPTTTISITTMPQPVWFRPDFYINVDFMPRQNVYLASGESYKLTCSSYGSAPASLYTMIYKERVCKTLLYLC